MTLHDGCGYNENRIKAGKQPDCRVPRPKTWCEWDRNNACGEAIGIIPIDEGGGKLKDYPMCERHHDVMAVPWRNEEGSPIPYEEWPEDG